MHPLITLLSISLCAKQCIDNSYLDFNGIYRGKSTESRASTDTSEYHVFSPTLSALRIQCLAEEGPPRMSWDLANATLPCLKDGEKLETLVAYDSQVVCPTSTFGDDLSIATTKIYDAGAYLFASLSLVFLVHLLANVFSYLRKWLLRLLKQGGSLLSWRITQKQIGRAHV